MLSKFIKFIKFFTSNNSVKTSDAIAKSDHLPAYHPDKVPPHDLQLAQTINELLRLETICEKYSHKNYSVEGGGSYNSVASDERGKLVDELRNSGKFAVSSTGRAYYLEGDRSYIHDISTVDESSPIAQVNVKLGNKIEKFFNEAQIADKNLEVFKHKAYEIVENYAKQIGINGYQDYLFIVTGHPIFPVVYFEPHRYAGALYPLRATVLAPISLNPTPNDGDVRRYIDIKQLLELGK